MNKKVKAAIFILFDVFSFAAAVVLSFVIVKRNVGDSLCAYYPYIIVDAAVVAVSFSLLGLYSSIWKYAGFSEAVKLLCAIAVFGIVNIVMSFLGGMSVSWAASATFLLFLSVCSTRFAYRFYGYYNNKTKGNPYVCKDKIRVMLIGAGEAGASLIREMQNSDKVNMLPVCVLDDNSDKIGQNISGVKVVGKIKDVVSAAEKYGAEEIILALPSAKKKRISEIIKECQKTKCRVKTIPGIYQMVNGQVSVSSIKDVNIADLLGREEIKVDVEDIIGYIEDKVVLVTGGGGSIGSELCRQIAGHNPKQLIILDIYENNAYDIQQELIRKYPYLNLVALIASVRDSKKMDKVFDEYRPEIVFHAAAHKHVPLMETSPNEAVKNNVSGTLKVARAADKYGVKRFVQISTDKAVNPTNIMGATKRICEMIIQTINRHSQTEFVAVRFGNVLGSNGSVIPLFKKQIENGGPITLTHKEITRYFMTIPEAVSLVLQAGAYAKGGEIFVLDMGEPVKIYDLAVNLIKLSGLEPYADIDIQITGLRPGEKLFEERLMKEEGMQKTQNKLISIGKPLQIDEENLFKKLEELYVEAYNETERMKELVKELVPTYIIDRRK